MAEGITVVNRAKTTLRAHSRAQVATTRVAILPLVVGWISLVVAFLDIKKSSFRKWRRFQGICGLSGCHAPVDAGLPAFLDQTAEAGHGLPRSGIRLRRLRKVHRGATAPSPAGNLPSERYLTRNFLLPATLDNVYCNRFFGKCNRNFLLFSRQLQCFGRRRGPLCEPSAPKACAVLWRDFAAILLLSYLFFTS